MAKTIATGISNDMARHMKRVVKSGNKGFVLSKKNDIGTLISPRPKHEKIGRNDPCPCGSGAKYKKCCMNSKG